MPEGSAARVVENSSEQVGTIVAGRSVVSHPGNLSGILPHGLVMATRIINI